MKQDTKDGIQSIAALIFICIIIGWAGYLIGHKNGYWKGVNWEEAPTHQENMLTTENIEKLFDSQNKSYQQK